MADKPFNLLSLPGVYEPGVYASVIYDSDPGLAAPNNRCLLTGYFTAGYQAVSDVPVRVLSQADADVLFGPKSMLSHAYAAAKKQIPVGAEVWALPLTAPSSGTAQVLNVEIVAEPSLGVLGAGTAALSADTVTVRLRGRGVTVGFKKDDSFEAIATAIETAWNKLSDAPATIGRSTAALTLTAPHKGDLDNGSSEVTFGSAGLSGVAAKMGTMTVANAAGGSGTCVISDGSKSVTVSVTNGDAATATGTAIVTKINSTSIKIRAAQPGTPSGVVTLYYVNGRPCRPLQVSSTETGLSGQTVTDAVGTAGVGVPTLTTALANIAAMDDSFKAWSLFFRSVTELGSIASHLVAQAVPPISKGQVAIFAQAVSYSAMVSANLPASTSPRLDAYTRFVTLLAQCAPNAEWELSARYCAAVAAETYVSRNWNGLELIGDDIAPCPAINPADRLSLDERNAAIGTYHTAPVVVNSAGRLAVSWGGNTYAPRGAKDGKLVKLSTTLTLDYFSYDLTNYLASLFSGKKIKVSGQPRTSNAVTPNGVKAAVYRWCVRMDDADLFDGAEKARDAIVAAVVLGPEKMYVNVPWTTLADLDLLAVSGLAG